MTQKSSKHKESQTPIKNKTVLKALTSNLEDININDQEIIVGRDEESDVIVNDMRISGSHMKIRKMGSDVIITDVSSNGTFINGKKLGFKNNRILRDGDVIDLRMPPNQSNEGIIQFAFWN
ncbi:MAG: hypothetical protein EZS28_003048 [Streblomastix strix]|uniref:FHA domain-containing protein n=1 Tax=Streblomastix strix TaxID=222440 RepID=A0A5J4X4I4_9EUKA|nr:MAG: hypothetical protein EZS28_003048 [Streblomastix strix]